MTTAVVDPCYEVTVKTCVGVVYDTVEDTLGMVGCEGDICSAPQDPCGAAGIDCGIVDPCDPNNTGQTCEDYLEAVVSDFLADPLGPIGFICDLYLCDLLSDPESQVETCPSICQDPVTTSCAYLNGCAVPAPCADATTCSDIAEAELDPEELAIDTAGEMLHADCDAWASGVSPEFTNVLTATGWTQCDKVHQDVFANVCIQIKKGGKWHDIAPCGHDHTTDDTFARAETSVNCIEGTHRYRAFSRGTAIGKNGKFHSPWDGGPGVDIHCKVTAESAPPQVPLT